MWHPGWKPETKNNPISFKIDSRVLYPALNHRQLSTAPGLWSSRAALCEISICFAPDWTVVGFEAQQYFPPQELTSRTRVQCPTSWTTPIPHAYIIHMHIYSMYVGMHAYLYTYIHACIHCMHLHTYTCTYTYIIILSFGKKMGCDYILFYSFSWKHKTEGLVLPLWVGLGLWYFLC